MIKADTHAILLDSSFQLIRVLYRVNGIFHGLPNPSATNSHSFGGFLISNKDDDDDDDTYV